MYIGFDLTPIDVGESKIISANFVKFLADGETITGATWVCAVADDSEVEDEDAADHVATPATFAGSRTFQRVNGLVAGVKYLLKAVIETDQDNTHIQWTHVLCTEPH